MVCIILVLLLPPICEMKKQVIWSENPEHRMAVVVAVDKKPTIQILDHISVINCRIIV